MHPLALLAAAAVSTSTPLFDGRSLDGWVGDPAVWSVRDGAITGVIPAGTNLARNAFLFHRGDFADFELELEFRLQGHPKANSGVQIRSAPHAGHEARGLQADIDAGRLWLGRIYEESGRGLLAERGVTTTVGPDGTKFGHVWSPAVPLGAHARTNDWNRYRITAFGPRVELRVNDRLFSVLEDHQAGPAAGARSGRIALQTHSGPGPVTVQFRNIRLTEFPAAPLPSPAPAAPPPDAGVSPAGLNLGFETGTLEGWSSTGDLAKGQPAKGNTVAARRPSQPPQPAGEFWFGGYEFFQDAPTGTLTSAAFPVTHPWGSFLVGGGKSPRQRVEIITMPEGRVIHRASGRDNETMSRVAVDLRPVQGRSIAVRIVDDGSAGWDHVNYDDFRFHAARPGAGADDRPDRLVRSPVLQPLRPNPAPATNANARAGGIVGRMFVPEGFRVDLVAAEPDLVQPIAFCFDARGRLWVVEGVSYPQRRKDGEAADRVLIFEDADGDGDWESRKVFLDGQNLVSGIEVGFGGVYLGAAPNLLFVPDRDGDDVPDGPAEVLLDGWGYQDTHETLNSLLWGPDGWLYGNQGVFVQSRIGRPGAPDTERIELRAGVWRFHPVTRAFEVFAHGGSNQWGLDYDAEGRLFMTHCRSAWGRGPTTHVVRGGHYWNQANNHHAAFIYGGPPGFDARSEPPFQNFLLSSARYDHGEGGAGAPGMNEIYGGHSHVGTLVYQGDNWPAPYRGHLLTLNLHGYQMNRQVLDARGSTVRAVHAGLDPLFVHDKTYMGVDLQSGPDGAVYFSDWTDTQHCHHNEVAKWDRGNGRIYRMAWAAGARPHPRPGNLADLPDGGLLALLDHANAWHQRTARRLLQERAAAGRLQPATAAALRSGPETLSRLWTAAACGVRRRAADFRPLLAHPDPARRAWAVTLATQLSPFDHAALAPALVRLAREDDSPVVRLALASALPRLGPADAWALGAALAARAEDAGDDLLPGLVWTGLAPHAERDPSRALALAKTTPLPALRDSIVWYAAREPAGRETLVNALAGLGNDALPRWLELFSLAVENRGRLAPVPGWATARGMLLARGVPGITAQVERIDLVHGEPEAYARLRARLADRTQPMPARQQAFKVLSEAGDAGSGPVFTALLEEPAFRLRAVPLAARFGDAATAARLVDLLRGAKGELQVALASALSSRPPMASALLDALADGRVPRGAVTALQARQIANLGDEALQKRLEQVWGKVRAGAAEVRGSVQRFTKLYRSAPLWSHDRKDGEAVFTKACAACHVLNGPGGQLGPDLSGTWRNGVDYFIENIVDPNAVVGEAFQLNVFTLKDGTVHSGLATPTPDGFLVQGPAGPAIPVRTADVKDRQVLDQSLMPPGLLEALSGKEVIDLLKFLSTEK